METARTTAHPGPTPARRRLKVVIADRSTHFRETVRRVLAAIAGCRVVGQGSTLSEAARLARQLQPDVVLLDVDLALGQPPARLRRLADAFPNLQVVVMLDDDTLEYRRAISERWGYACISKDQAEMDVEAVIIQALQHGTP